MKSYGLILLRLPRWPLWGLAPLAVTSALALSIEGIGKASLQSTKQLGPDSYVIDPDVRVSTAESR